MTSLPEAVDWSRRDFTSRIWDYLHADWSRITLLTFGVSIWMIVRPAKPFCPRRGRFSLLRIFLRGRKHAASARPIGALIWGLKLCCIQKFLGSLENFGHFRNALKCPAGVLGPAQLPQPETNSIQIVQDGFWAVFTAYTSWIFGWEDWVTTICFQCFFFYPVTLYNMVWTFIW